MEAECVHNFAHSGHCLPVIRVVDAFELLELGLF